MTTAQGGGPVILYMWGGDGDGDGVGEREGIYLEANIKELVLSSAL